MACAFTESAAKRIAAAVKRIERTPVDLRGDAARSYEPGRDFFALLLGVDMSGRWTFVPVTPDPAGIQPDAFLPLSGDGIRWAFEGDPFVDAAREANGNVAIDNRTIVKMQFAGYDGTGSPVFVFIHAITESGGGLAPHDHRDNFAGGFAFSTFHPGTSIPQLPYPI